MQLGNSVNLGISVGGNIGKGRGNDESHTLWHTHIGDKGSQTVIQSGGTSLRGAQVIGKGIRTDSRNLNLESVQDTAAYHGKQQNGSLQITAANTEINQHLDSLKNNWKKVKSAKRNTTAKLPTGSAEVAVPVISNWLYGEIDGSALTAEQKETVSAITNLLGATTGAAIDNSSTNATQGSLNAQNAVENNYLTSKQLIEIDKAHHECGDEICKQHIL